MVEVSRLARHPKFQKVIKHRKKFYVRRPVLHHLYSRVPSTVVRTVATRARNAPQRTVSTWVIQRQGLPTTGASTPHLARPVQLSHRIPNQPEHAHHLVPRTALWLPAVSQGFRLHPSSIHRSLRKPNTPI